jgi:Arc/MetJ family transcription regulator
VPHPSRRRSLPLNSNLHSALPDNPIRMILHGIASPVSSDLGYMPGFPSGMAQGSELALKSTSIDDNIVPNMEINVRTTLALDDELVAKAQAFTGLKEKSSLVREALKALIERESARRLARLGGSQPRLKAPPRRRPISA